MELRIDTSEMVILANKLEKINRSAFPVAVRNSLNSAAFDVKQRTMPSQASKAFTQRQKNFFKANSRVNMARGFDVDTMVSEVGFIPLNGTNHAVDDLEQQEHGGSIDGRAFIPLNQSRVGKSYKKNVKKPNRISGVRNVVNAKKMSGENKKQRFLKAIFEAGAGGHILSENGFLIRVDQLPVNGLAKLTPLFSYKRGRKVKVKATHFMEKSSIESGKRIDTFFKREVIKQLKRNNLR